MSVRAYKILKPIETAKEPLFNLWHDEEVMDALENADCIITRSGGDISGIEINTETAEMLLKNYKGDDKFTKNIFKQLAADCEETGYASYVCY